MNNKELELEAEKYYKENVEGEPLTYETPIHCFIAGATSDAAKQYWYKQFEKQKLEFAIEQLNKLDTVLQSKIETLKNMANESNDFDNSEYFTIKIAGIKLAKEEIRRDIKEFEQKLKEYETD